MTHPALQSILNAEGGKAALMLAFQFFLERITHEQFDSWTIPAQLEWAEGNAHLKRDELVAAFRFIGNYHMRHANALRNLQ